MQIAFPGLYPDLTRYQAEFEQGQVNTGQGLQQWRLSAVTTAQNFAEFVLGWDPNAPTTVLSGGGTHDAKALILVKNPSAGDATISSFDAQGIENGSCVSIPKLRPICAGG